MSLGKTTVTGDWLTRAETQQVLTMLEDGGHRITAAYKIFKETGRDVMVPVHKLVSKFQ